MQKWKGREVGIRSGGNGFYERARRAESLARCGERFFYFFVETRVDTGFQKGISRSSTHFIRAQRGNEDSDLRAGTRLRALP